MRAHRRTHPSTAPPHWRRDIRLLAAGRGISMAGAEAGYIALIALAWQITGSASQASIVLLASVFARTFGAPLAGWLGDHVDRRTVIVVGELAAAASFGSLALATQMWHVLLLMAAGTFAASCCGSALDAALPNLAPAHELAVANSTLGIGRTTGHMVGPVLGGLAVAAFGARSAFMLDAASSVLAAVIVLGIRGRFHEDAEARAARGAVAKQDRSVLAGLQVLAADPVLRMLSASWAGMCVCFAFVTAAELPLAVEFGVDEPGLGAIISVWCAGSLIGSWLARRVRVEQRGTSVLAWNGVVCAAVFAGAGVMPEFAGVLVMMAIGGMSMALAEVVETTLVQQRVADDVRARVLAAYGGLMSAVWGTNLAVAGLFVEAFSARAAYVYAGLWCVVSALGFGLMARRAARLDRARELALLRPRHALESELVAGA